MPPVTLTIAGEAFVVLAIEPGPLGALSLTLAKCPEIKPGRLDHVLMLRKGANLEPVRLIERPQGGCLLVRRFY